MNTALRGTEETKQTTERAAHRRGWTVAKYMILTACGFALYRAGATCALAERGYIAVGGEVFFLFFPIFYYLFSTMIRDLITDIKTNFKEESENEETL